jgi:hypothetical protein
MHKKIKYLVEKEPGELARLDWGSQSN